MTLHEGGDYREMISGIEPEPAPAPQTAPVEDAKPAHTGWIYAHPFFASTLGIIGLIVLGGTIVLQRTDVNPASDSGAWGGAGGMFFGSIRKTAPIGPTVDDVTRLQSAQEQYATIPIYTPSSEDPQAPAGIDDVKELLSLLVQPTAVTTSAPTNPAVPDSYSFIPQGLVSTEPVVKKRTAAQEKLFQYGNEVGTYVKGYEDTHYNSAQVLKDHIEDRKNPDKIRALKALGTDLQQLGTDLKGLPEVPPDAAGMHKVYANAYYAVGGNLVLIADTTTDEEFVAAITKYNALVEKLSTQFQLLVVLFGANGVTFSSSDPGNIFMFSGNLSMLQ